MTVKTFQEQEKRRKCLTHARSELRLEGLSTSPQAAPLFEKYERGELSREELRQQLLALHSPR